MKVTLPYFLSSKFGKNISADGSSFDVALEQPISIPSGRRVLAYVQSADVPYVMANVSATKQNNTLILARQHKALHQWYFRNIALGGAMVYRQTYKITVEGTVYTYPLTVSNAQLDSVHTVTGVRDLLNTLSTAALLTAHPTLVGHTSPILSPTSTTPIRFHHGSSAKSSVGYNTESEISAMAKGTQFLCEPDMVVGETLA